MRGYRDTVIYQNHGHGDTFVYIYIYIRKNAKNIFLSTINSWDAFPES
jgi:hypothetical protein